MEYFLTKNLIAHRGIHEKEIPENTISSFKEAIKKNYIIELDLRLSKDNEIVVFHDENLKRLFNIDKNISDMNYESIKEYKFKNGDIIPLFKDVLKIVNGKVPMLIEIKPFDKNAFLLDKMIKLLDKYEGKYAIQSFDHKLIKLLKKKYPKVVRGILLNSTTGLYNKLRSKPDFLSCKLTIIENKRIQKYRKNNIVLAWTIRKQDDFDYAKNYTDNYICEYFNIK